MTNGTEGLFEKMVEVGENWDGRSKEVDLLWLL